ncbi:MAG: CxxC-x17-CxxC domain-containing protein [Patescibacteria group bacterium]
MGNFNRDNKKSSGGFNRGFGGGKSFGNEKRFGGRDGGKPAMYKATCSECGASCELPFKPTGDRPVFCRDCFGKQGGGGGRPNKFGGERREKPRFEDRQMHNAVCAKCGKDCQVPFRPTAGKPIFCNDCFDKGGSGSPRGEAGSKDSSGGIMEQIKMLNAKVDKLIKVLIPNASVEKVDKSEFRKEVMVKEVVKGKAKTKIASKKISAKKKK